MSSIPTSEMRSSATKRTGATGASTDVAEQIDAIRADIEALTSTVARIANRQLSRAQDKRSKPPGTPRTRSAETPLPR